MEWISALATLIKSILGLMISFLPELITIFVSAFVALFVREYMKRPKIVFDSIRCRNRGEIQKFSFRVENADGFWFLERDAAEDCKAALKFPKKSGDGGLVFKKLTTRLLWRDDGFGSDYVEKRNIYSGEEADAFGIQKYDGGYYHMHTEERIHESGPESLEERSELSEKHDKFLIVVKTRNGFEMKKEFKLDDLEDISEEWTMESYP
ncbi:MAG: hypothetical protein ABEJ83_02700 [Candidatus Nanohaloarchaea archaeon]